MMLLKKIHIGKGMYQSATGQPRCVKRSLSVSLVSYARPRLAEDG